MRLKTLPNKTWLALFVDVEDAYGSVAWEPLFKLIDKLNFWNTDEKNLYKFILTNSKIKFNNAEGRCTKGIPQGSRLSCELFTLYMGMIMKQIRLAH
jgi:hypothetical protein